MTALLALDPGLIHPAVALFRDGILLAAERVKVPKSLAKLNVGQRCLEVARLIRDAAPGTIDELVIEWPRVYTGAKAKGDPADLFPLVGVGTALAAWYDVPVTAVTPSEWLGGNVAKSTKGDPRESPRGDRIWSRLSESERACLELSHDAFDACGIGLWRLGRFRKIRVLPGAV